jgi:hypothetical protein
LIDMDALLLAPIYAQWSVPAVFTDRSGVERTIRLIDHRDGTNLTAARGYSGSQNMLPRGVNAEEAIVMIRRSECPAKPLMWTLELDDTAYRVASALKKGGEWVCTLEEA